MRKRWLVLIFLSIFLVSCKPSHLDADGYVEGRYTYMASSVGGVLEKLFVARGQQVKKDQPLFLLELRPQSDVYDAALDEWRAALASKKAIEANLVFDAKTYERYQELVKKHAIEQSQLDAARATYFAKLASLEEASASVATKKAKVAEAAFSKEQKLIKAPVDGFVFDTYYRIGERTTENTPILSLLAPQEIRAVFYVNPQVLAHLHLRDEVTININREKFIKAHISYISPSAEYTPPVIYSEATNSKLIFRIEAECNVHDASLLHPGQPINVTYDWHD